MEQYEGSHRYRFLRPALKFESQLRACLTRLTQDPSVVSDLLQETWIRLLVAGESQAPFVGSVQAYAIQTAKNIARDWLRRRKVVPILLVGDYEALDVMGDASPQPDQIVNGRQELERLVKIASTMPPKQRQVFALKKVYELTQREIAIRMGIKEHTVERHLQKAAQWLVKRLSEPEDCAPARRTFGRVRSNP